MVSVCRIGAAGFEDYPLQFIGSGHRLRKFCPAHPFEKRLVIVLIDYGCGRSRHESITTFIEEFVHHKTKRVNVSGKIIPFAVEHFRSHVGERPLTGKSYPGLFDHSGYAKITEFEVPVF